MPKNVNICKTSHNSINISNNSTIITDKNDYYIYNSINISNNSIITCIKQFIKTIEELNMYSFIDKGPSFPG